MCRHMSRLLHTTTHTIIIIIINAIAHNHVLTALIECMVMLVEAELSQ